MQKRSGLFVLQSSLLALAVTFAYSEPSFGVPVGPPGPPGAPPLVAPKNPPPATLMLFSNSAFFFVMNPYALEQGIFVPSPSVLSTLGFANEQIESLPDDVALAYASVLKAPKPAP